METNEGGVVKSRRRGHKEGGMETRASVDRLVSRAVK